MTAHSQTGGDLRPIRVLLVEDNIAHARAIGEGLCANLHERFDLVCADRLSKGLETLVKGRVDILLLDLNLPDSGGLATFDRFHRAAPQVPVVIMTGLDDPTLGQHAVAAGARDVLLKGQIEPSLLARVIQHTVEKSRLEATHRSVQRGQSSLFDHSLEPMLLLDDEFRCGAANTAASLLLGRAISQLRGTEAAEFLVLGPDWSQAWARWKENGILDGVCQFVRPDGRVGDLEFSLTPRCVGKQHLMVLRDCSHRREIEERLRCGSEQWKTLAQQRQALLQQSLAAQDVLERELRLALRYLRQSKDVATVQRRVESAVSQLRKSCGGAPAGRMGPMEALRSQARDFQERTGIQCKISSKLADRSDGESPATRFCPILEKALSNVAIHGTATMVHVRLSRESGKWILEVEDDGHSLTETQMTDAQTFRLCGVREQVLRFGGDLTLQGLPGRGTKLRVWLPGEAKTRPRRQA